MEVKYVTQWKTRKGWSYISYPFHMTDDAHILIFEVYFFMSYGVDSMLLV